jgi:aminoglycoside N3'-acetyltransferase
MLKLPDRIAERRASSHDGERQWIDTLQMGIDGGTHFPKIGAAFCQAQSIKKRRVGEAETYFVSTRALVDFAVHYFGGVDRQECV